LAERAAVRHDYPYWRLSAFYFAYFGLLGAMVPFWSLFLQGRGYSLGEIALLAAVPMATRIVAPNIWGWIADHRGARLPIVRAGALATLLVFAFVWWADGFWTMALVIAGYSFFWNAVLPQFEVVTLNHLGPRMAEYSRVRLWGSVGFIVAVIGLGAVFDVLSIEWLPLFMLVLMLALWMTALATHEAPAAAAAPARDGAFGQRLREPAVWVILVACLLINLSHGPYYTYFSIHMEEAGWSRVGIGMLWSIGVLAEVLVFIVMHRMLASFGALRVLAVAAGGAVLRWLLLAYGGDGMVALLFAQLLHAVTFGFFHAAGIHLVFRVFVGAGQGRGQALFASFSYGLGGALGALAAGALWPAWGAQAAFAAMAGVALIALVLVLLVARHPLFREA
jgi:PPP family 3-phenylpropionic acid transporter